MAKLCLSALLVVVLLASCVSDVTAKSSQKDCGKRGMIGHPA